MKRIFAHPFFRSVYKKVTHPFFKFIFKKAIFYLIVAFIALTFIFLIPRLMPGNPIDQMIPPGTTDVGRLRLRAELSAYFGLNKTLPEQYIDFWSHLLKGNLGLGMMRQYNFMPVAKVVMEKLPYTIALVVPVLFIGFFIGNWIGARAAYTKGKLSEAGYFTSIFVSQMPFYWFAMVLLFLLAVNFKIFPTHGTFSPRFIPGLDLTSFLDAGRHYVLPFLTLLIITTGGWASGMRSMTLYELDSGYILYGRQLGFRNKKLLSYAKRNAILPQFTGLNINLNNLIGMTMIIEMVFQWNGLGLLALQAVQARDYFMILGTFLVTMVVVIIGNFLVDIAYAFLDPRIRTGRGG
ncbi:MAG TPA: ABC transporter permease [Candidatus Bathyarchaeia archaeon]|nr:ABC transporter permease [Candidatus Bathyarchaeia archaeon]